MGIAVPPQFANSPTEFTEAAARHPKADVVISAELLTRKLGSPRRANPILSFFAQCGFEVVLVGYFRNQPQRMNSGYSQGVKSLRRHISFENRVASWRSAGALDYTTCTNYAAEYGIRLLARPFNAAVKSNGVVQDFLKTLGVDPQAFKIGPEPRNNVSIGPCAVAAVQETVRRAAERKHRWTDEQKAAAKALITRIAQEPEFAERPFCGFDTKGARAIQAFFQPSNDRFAKAAWGEDWAAIYKQDVEAEFERNVYEPATATAQAKELYGAILERFWSGMQPIMNDPAHAEAAAVRIRRAIA